MIVNKEKCICCMTCVNSCPVGAIKVVDGKAQIDKKICIKCGYCKSICPVSAIKED